MRFLLQVTRNGALNSGSPLPIEVSRSRAPRWKLEPEALLEQARGNDAAALQDEFGFSAHEEGADFEHPCADRHTEGDAGRFTQQAHEIRVRQGPWSGHIHDATHVLVLEKPTEGRNEVAVVNPRHKLTAIAGSCTQAATRKTA